MAPGRRAGKSRRPPPSPPPSSDSSSSGEEVIPLDAVDRPASAAPRRGGGGGGGERRGGVGRRRGGRGGGGDLDAAAAAAADSDADDDSIAGDGGGRSGSGSGSGSDGEDDEDDEDYVDASFAFFDPRPDDVPRLRSLLLDLARSLPVPDAAIYAHTLAEAVAAQTRVGTTVRVDAGCGPGDEVLGDALGFITALPLATHPALLAPLLAAIDKATAGGPSPSWAAAPGTKLGVVLCERVVNLPPALVPWLHTALWDELGWAVEDEPTAALRDAYALTHYVVLTDVYAAAGGGDGGGGAGGGGGGKRRKSKKRRTAAAAAVAGPGATPVAAASVGADELGFTRVEDGVWFRHASAVALWAVPGEETARGGLARQRLAMLVPAAEVPAVRSETEALRTPAAFETSSK